MHLKIAKIEFKEEYRNKLNDFIKFLESRNYIFIRPLKMEKIQDYLLICKRKDLVIKDSNGFIEIDNYTSEFHNKYKTLFRIHYFDEQKPELIRLMNLLENINIDKEGKYDIEYKIAKKENENCFMICKERKDKKKGKIIVK